MSVVSGQSVGTVEVLPSGIPVYFQSKPKRLYRIGPKEARDMASDNLLYSAQVPEDFWREVPSVTTVLGVLDKPALPWWSQGVACESIIELVRMRELVVAVAVTAVLSENFLADMGERPEGCGRSYLAHKDGTPATKESIVALLTEHKLSCNHQRDHAASRGQAVHDAFEAWARTGHKPDPGIYPDEERGYVEGLLAFLADVPSIEPIAAEVLVASAEHGYAGRYDIRFRTSVEHEVVVKRGKRKVETRTLMPGTYLGDLKSSKGVYPSHARQLEGYEQASIESGYEPTDGRGILHVGADGTYEFVRSWACVNDFLCVLAVWQSEQNMKAAK